MHIYGGTASMTYIIMQAACHHTIWNTVLVFLNLNFLIGRKPFFKLNIA